MDLTDEQLMAYADGQADAATRAAVEAAMARDAGVRERVEKHLRLRGTMARAFGGTLNEPVPERLLAAARGEARGHRPSRPAEIVDLAAVRARKAAPPPARAPRAVWMQWTALAACLAVGVILARGLAGFGASPLIRDRAGALIAQGTLAQALDQQIAGSGAQDQAVRIGVSFHADDKTLCRTFQVMRGDALAGLACRVPGGWQVRVAAASAPVKGPADGYRTAGSSIPPAVSASVDAMIVGAPLDAQAEAAAKAKGWRE